MDTVAQKRHRWQAAEEAYSQTWTEQTVAACNLYFNKAYIYSNDPSITIKRSKWKIPYFRLLILGNYPSATKREILTAQLSVNYWYSSFCMYVSYMCPGQDELLAFS